MALLEDKRNEFVRRAALHSSRQSADQAAASFKQHGQSQRTLLRKRVSYPLSSKTMMATAKMSSTLPARKPLARRSVGGMSSTTGLASMLGFREKRLNSSVRKHIAIIERSDRGPAFDRTENTEPNCPNRSDSIATKVETACPPKHSTSRDALVEGQSGCSAPEPVSDNKVCDIAAEASAALEMVITGATVSVYAVEQTSSESTSAESASAAMSSVGHPDASDVHEDRLTSPPQNLLNVDKIQSGEDIDLPMRSGESAGSESPKVCSGLRSPSDSASPSSAASSSHAGSTDLHRIVEAFRSSSVKKQCSRPSSRPQSPSTLSSNRSVCSPINEQRIEGRLIEDEWKRRARAAEDAIAKMRKELHQAESTYEEVLKKCAAETKEAVSKLTKSLEDEQVKVLDANVEIGILHVELQRAQQETRRMRNTSRIISVVLILLMAIIICDNLRRQSVYCS